MAKPTSYASYMHLAEILSSQVPQSPRDEVFTYAAERYFIICHQVSELLVSQILADLEYAASAISSSSADWGEPRVCLVRAASMTLLLSRQMEQLLHLCPRGAFRQIRQVLEGFSASESPQFRALLGIPTGSNSHAQRILAALETLQLCAQTDVSAGPTCWHDPCIAADALTILTGGCVLWREFHVFTAATFIGTLPGTGGTSGVDYLLRRLGNGHPVPATFSAERLMGDLLTLDNRVRALLRPVAHLKTLDDDFGFESVPGGSDNATQEGRSDMTVKHTFQHPR